MAEMYGRVGGEELVNASRPGNQVEPKITSLAGGGYVVVWTDQNVTGNFESRGQVFADDGTPVGGEFLINSAASGNQFQPYVAALEGGGFVVSFTDGIGDGAGNTGIRLQMFDATGGKVGAEFSANATAAGNQTISSVAGLPGGGFVALWGDSNTTSGDVVARVFDASGAGGTEFVVNSFTTNTQSGAIARVLSDGNIVVAWNDSGGADGSGTGVRARIFTAAGVAVGAEFALSTTTTLNQGNVALTALKDGGFAATWVDYSLLGGDAATNSIKAQVFDNAGTKVGSETLVNTYTHYIQEEPSISALDSGGFVITFTDRSGFGGDTQDSGSKAIKGQVFNADGTKDGIEFLINTTIAQNQWQSAVAGLGNGGFAVAWVDASGVHDNTGYGIVSQVFTLSDGTIADIELSGTSVSETAVENSIIGTLSADGPVTVARDLTYTIVSDSTGGAFGIKGDKLIVADNAKLDFESATSATVTIRVDDGNGHVYQESFVIGVTDAAIEARWHAGNDTAVNATSTADQSLQAMAALTGGGYVITWTDASLTIGDSTGQAIHGQRFDNFGNKVGGEFLVNTTTAGNQTASSVVATADGGFLVVWQDSGVSPSAIRGQVFGADGGRVGSEFQVDDGTGGASLPEVVLLNSGNYLVSWQDSIADAGTGTGGTTGIRGQLVDATGAKVGSEFSINTTNINGSQEDPAIAATSTGFVAIWADRNSAGVIRANFFDNTGAQLRGEFQVNTNSANNQLKPTATVLSDGNVLFTWWDLSLVGGDNSNGGIRGRIYDTTSGTLGTEFLMNTTINLDQDAPRVAALPGGFMLVFEDRSEYLLGNIRAQQFDNSGAKVGEEFIATYDTGWAQKVPTIAVLADGGLAIAWYDGKNIGSNDPNGWDIETRVFHAAVSGADPVAVDDAVSAFTGVATTYAAADLLGNDSHAFGTLAIARVTSGAGGTAVLNPDGSVTFTSAPGFTGAASFTYLADDGEGGTATATVTVDVTQPNTPPTLAANTGLALDEGATATIGATALDYDDAEQADGAIVYTIASAPANGTLRLDGTALGLNDTFSQDDIVNGRLSYEHDGGETTGDSFGFTVSDGAGGSVSGGSFAISVAAVDDGPTLTATGLSPTYLENAASADLFGSVTASTVEIGQSFASLTLTVSNVTDGAAEILTFDGSDIALTDGNAVVTATNGLSVAVAVAAGIATVSFAGAALSAAALQTLVDGLTYRNTSEDPTDGSRVVTITELVDTGAGSAPDANTTALSIVSTVDVDAVNDEPTGDDETIVVNEDDAHPFSLADFNFGDADGDGLSQVVITTLPTAGTLLLNNVAVGAGDPIDAADIAAGLLTYEPAADANGAGYASFTFQVRDGGGTANGGQDTDQAPNTITLDVTAVNDAPVNVVLGAVSATEDDVGVVLSTTGLAMSVSDVEATGPVVYSLSVSNGTLTIRDDVPGGIDASHIQVLAGTGNGTAVINIAATLSQINTTLAASNGLLYTPDADFSGSDTLAVYLNDGGQSGLDPNPSSLLEADSPGIGAATEEDFDTRTITVTAVDDAPVARADAVTTAENAVGSGSLFADNGSGADVDVDGPALSIAAVNGVGANVGTQVTLASGALLTVNADGSYSYDPNGAYDYLISSATAAATGALNASASDSFSYTLAGGNTASVTVTVSGIDGAGDQLRGGAGNDSITGTVAGAVFNLSQGGEDSATGQGGNDGFYMGAALSASDVLDGGAGSLDQLGLQGNYGAPFVFSAGHLTNIEMLVLLSGSDARFGDTSGASYSYTLKTIDANVGAGEQLAVSFNTLQAGESVTFDGSDESDGWFLTFGGLGSDTLTGGAQDDRFYFGNNGLWGAGDSVDGGAGSLDQLGLQGSYTVAFGAGQLAGIEMLVLLTGGDTRFGNPAGTGYSYDVTMDDGNVAAGQMFYVSANTLRAGVPGVSDETLAFDGSGESDGRFTIYSGAGDDTLTGGEQDDTIYGAGGADAMTGGLGNDTFAYIDAAHSSTAAMDQILDFGPGDRINLAAIDAVAGGANNAFTFIGAAAFGNIAGQLRAFDTGGGVWHVEGDIDGNGTADLVIAVTPAAPLIATDFIL